jgi:predicted DNA-binding transcriptional regulator YafY
MSRPTTRVLAVLELLQAHGRLSGAELARRLEVDPRSVRRMVATLEELGIPIVAERGRQGGYELVAGFKLPPMLFTDDEALALSVGLLAAGELGLAGAAPGVESARAKLERVMPAALRHRARLAETMTLDLPAREPADPGVLLALAAAAQAGQRVRCVHQSGDAASERDLDPYGLAFRGGRWYVLGFCHLRGGPRTFRVDRLRQVRPLAERFARPAGLDLLAQIERSLAALPRAFAVEVLLHCDLATAQAAIFAAFGLLEPAEGGVILLGQTDDLAWFARELARLPFTFEIRAPDALRSALRGHAERLAALAS